MGNLHIILSLSGSTAGLLLTTITVMIRLLKSRKARRVAEQAIQISNAVLPFIREAECFKDYSSVEKKTYVMTKANQFAIKNKIPFNEGKVGERVDELVDLTKCVNTRGGRCSQVQKKSTQENTTNPSSSWL